MKTNIMKKKNLPARNSIENGSFKVNSRNFPRSGENSAENDSIRGTIND